MILTGILLYQQNIIIPANIFGKASTFLFYISILFIVFSKISPKYTKRPLQKGRFFCLKND